MKHQESSTMAKLATTVVLTLLLLTMATPHIRMVSALVPSGGEQKSLSDVLLFCASSWRKVVPGKDSGCSGSESLSVTSSSSKRQLASLRLSLKAGKKVPYPPSPTQNQRSRMGSAPPPLSLRKL